MATVVLRRENESDFVNEIVHGNMRDMLVFENPRCSEYEHLRSMVTARCVVESKKLKSNITLNIVE